MRTEIGVPGTRLLDLATEPGWQGEITEFGFLVAGDNGKTVEVGHAAFLPDDLGSRLQLTWQGWSTFEEWTQKSINFIYGGDYRQVLALPLLVAAWLVLALLLTGLILRFSKKADFRQLLVTAAMAFLIAWMLLDIRWSANNLRQSQFSLASLAQSDLQQRLSTGLDGDVYQVTQRLKDEVFGSEPARILILGDDNYVDYELLRAKYHLLPHSANVSDHPGGAAPESLDFVVFFGQSIGITNLPGWDAAWQRSLVEIDRGNWGTVYRVDDK
jgi:hypothetical protein